MYSSLILKTQHKPVLTLYVYCVTLLHYTANEQIFLKEDTLARMSENMMKRYI